MKLRLLLITTIVLFLLNSFSVLAQEQPNSDIKVRQIQVQTQVLKKVLVLDMNMMILPGTAEYLASGITKAKDEGYSLIVVKLNTPGGMLSSSQNMIESIFKSDTPIVVYVSPTGGVAASAGVFITMAGNIAAMAPGTSIGAAHPVQGDGKNIESDMRAKAENMTTAMIRSIAEQRGRNIAWAEKSVKESSSLTEGEALKENVIDIVADDLNDLFKKIEGRKTKINNKEITLSGFITPNGNLNTEVTHFQQSIRVKAVNLIANPNIMALLWLGATTGIAAELYHPGLIFPGVFGAICLILALAMGDVIPITQGAIFLLAFGSLLIGAELFFPSGILAVGGIVSIILGLIYFVDVSKAPDISIALESFIPALAFLGGLAFLVIYKLVQSRKLPLNTGMEGLIGQSVVVIREVGDNNEKSEGKIGKVKVNGEIWDAVTGDGVKILVGESAKVVGSVKDRLILKIERS